MILGRINSELKTYFIQTQSSKVKYRIGYIQPNNRFVMCISSLMFFVCGAVTFKKSEFPVQVKLQQLVIGKTADSSLNHDIHLTTNL